MFKRSRWHNKNQTVEASISNPKALCSWGLSTAGHSSRLRNDGILRPKPSQSYGQSSELTRCSSPQQGILHLAVHFYGICKNKCYSSVKFATVNRRLKIIGQNPLRNRTKLNHSKNYSSVFQTFRWLMVTSLTELTLSLWAPIQPPALPTTLEQLSLSWSDSYL